jgi:hypothetical protein
MIMNAVVKRGDYFILEQGYRPNGTVDASKPPKGGSAVPSIIPSSVHHEQHTDRKTHAGRHKK